MQRLECLDNTGFELRVAELTAHAVHTATMARALATAALLAHHRFPEPVVALRPSSLRTPQGQRLRSAQCAGLLFKHVEIVFQIEDLLRTIIAALMPRDALTAVSKTQRRRSRRELRQQFPASAARSREVSAHLPRSWPDRHAGSLPQPNRSLRKGSGNRCSLLSEQQLADTLCTACHHAVLIMTTV